MQNQKELKFTMQNQKKVSSNKNHASVEKLTAKYC